MHRQFLYSAQLIEKDELTTVNSFHSIDPPPGPSRKARHTSFDQKDPLISMISILAKKARNKKCYVLQVLKQFLLFPDSSTPSSCISISRYDPLLFSDEKLHSLFKIMETQYTSRKIWAFINLKANRKIQNIKEGLSTFSRVTAEVTLFQKEESFHLIKISSVKKERTTKLGLTPNYSFLINNYSQLRPNQPDKLIKLETSSSKRTNAESSRSMMFSGQRQFSQQPSYCQFCCSCCCCCSQEDFLWQRIQYLKQLEQMVQKRQRQQTYSQI